MKKHFALVVAAAALAGCGSVLQQADEAYAREDWDKAITLYEKALAGEDELGKIEQIKGKIQRTKKAAGAACANEARNRLRTKEYETALQNADRAYGYDNSSEHATLKADVKRDYARFLFSQGKAQLDSGFVDEALRSIEKAHSLDPTSETTALLQDLRARMRERGRGDFAQLVTRANEFFDKRAWSDAVAAYAEALRAQEDPTAREKQEFSLIMADAEKQMSSRPAEAKRLLEKARAMGYHRTYVESLLKRVR